MPLLCSCNISAHVRAPSCSAVTSCLHWPGPVKTPIWSKSRDVSQQLMQLLPPIAQQLYGTLIHRVSELHGKLC